MYVEEKEMPLSTIKVINHVRLFKKMMLPCELIGFHGNKITKEAREVMSESSIKWKIKFDIVSKPYKRLVEEWTSFVEWLKLQHIETLIIDFSKFMQSVFEVTEDKKYIREYRNNEVLYYEKKEVRYRRIRYAQTNAISSNL